MTEQDLQKIEAALDIQLPDEYRQIMLAYPFPQDTYMDDYELLNDPNPIIESNNYYRANGFFGGQWNPNYFAFGGDGSGNEWFLDVRDEQSSVYFADHETGSRTIKCSSMKEWVNQRQIEFEEFEFEEEAKESIRIENRKRHEKWWQFWK